MMARLNEGQSGQNSQIGRNADAYEALKQKYLQQNRQNKEISRSHSVLTKRVHDLQIETTRLLTDNISLREQVLRLEVELARRDQERKTLQKNQATQKKLEEKMAEVGLLLRELNQPCTPLAKCSTPPDDDSSPYLESRLLRDSYIPGEGLEGYMPAIEEEAQSRRCSMNSERRRSTLNFADIELPPPAPESYEPVSDDDNDNDPPPPMNNVESRPRRRRDSDLVRQHTSIPEPVPEPMKSVPTLAVPKPPKRKFAEKDLETSPISPDLDFRFSKLSARAAEAAKRQMEAERPSSQNNEDNEDTAMAEAEPAEDSSKRITLSKSSHARRLSGSGNIPSLAARKALGPKSTNADPANSPIKIAARSEQKDPEHPEKQKISEKLPPTTTRIYRSNSVRDKDTPPPESDPTATGGTATGRAARRTRPSVSYAEPSLRVKMRRAETGFVDAVTGEGKVRRTTPVSEPSSARKKSLVEDEIVVKSEENDCAGTSKWMDLPSHKSTEEPQGVTKSPTILNEEEGEEEEERKTRRRESAYEGQPILPSSVMTSRKRRTSSLVTSLSGINDHEQPDLKRKIDDSDRARSAGRLMSHPRSQSPDEEETRSRRSTLAARVKTLNPYDDEDRGEDRESRRERAVGTSNRRRSMMV
ncbi:hypothetical protein K440DRAFT_257630 [Wilcoxina mikolae CBS 423.85]|nr:hypothetical protein K440DRAFT_257630 [Wilcoxina mikolae CBS 423.85]